MCVYTQKFTCMDMHRYALGSSSSVSEPLGARKGHWVQLKTVLLAAQEPLGATQWYLLHRSHLAQLN